MQLHQQQQQLLLAAVGEVFLSVFIFFGLCVGVMA
jgi:hypothetical protein